MNKLSMMLEGVGTFSAVKNSATQAFAKAAAGGPGPRAAARLAAPQARGPWVHVFKING